MPQFVNTQCANCSKPNRFDLAELRKEDRSISKNILSSQGDKSIEEFIVTCQHCGKKFKIMVKGKNNGKT